MDTFEKLAHSDSPEERLWAAQAYCDVAGEKQTAISLCISVFERDGLQHDALRLLAKMGGEAAIAYPAIVEHYSPRFKLDQDDEATKVVTRNSADLGLTVELALASL